MGVWLLFLVHREYLLWRSNKTIESDKRAYQALWNTIISQPDGLREISDLQAAVDCLGEGVVAVRRKSESAAVAHMLAGRRRSEPATLTHTLQTARCGGKYFYWSSVNPWERLVQVNARDEIENEVWPFIPGRRQLEEGTVRSIDQLYMQAVIVEPIFQQKVKELAAASNGQFQAKISQDVNLKMWTALFFKVLVCVQWCACCILVSSFSRPYFGSTGKSRGAKNMCEEMNTLHLSRSLSLTHTHTNTHTHCRISFTPFGVTKK
jgi:hypothetical protein